MNDLPRIDSNESLEAWLADRPPSDAAIIASRSAMRVAPFWMSGIAEQKKYLDDLPGWRVCRLLLTAVVFAKFPEPEIRSARALSREVIGPDRSFSLYDSDPAYSAARATRQAALAGPHSGYAFEAASQAGTEFSTAFLLSAELDVRDAHVGRDPMVEPLWRLASPLSLIADHWEKAKSYMSTSPGGSFWTDWYQRALEGRPQNWPLLRAVALIDNALWEQGGEALDKAINDLRQKHALAATANGERVEINPDTGNLHLVPDTRLPEAVAVYVRRKIIKAVEIFDDQTGQAYGGLVVDLKMLRRAVEDAGNLPVELFDACASASLRLSIRINSGDCPSAEQDPLIADYRARLRDAGAEIVAADPETQKVLERRAAIDGNDALIDARAPILELVDAVQPVLEGRLADVLPEDAEIATDPDQPEEERAAASFRLSGRLLQIERAVRLGKDVWKGFAAANSAISKIGGYLKSMEFLASAPAIKDVIAAILRYIGF